MAKHKLIWSYGVTTVPLRIEGLLPRTLKSLAGAGFDEPQLFVDGAKNTAQYERFGLSIACHFPTIRIFGNWVLALWELYVRSPSADRYAIFQDDFVTYKNLRQYLDQCAYPDQGYWNLYTFPQNQILAPTDGSTGWYLSNQCGKGAVALVFSHEAVTTLLVQPYMVARPQDCKRGWCAVDGGIISAFKKVGWKEYVHNPSLVQHTGIVSSMRNKPHQLAESFRGEDFDAMELIK